MRGLVCVAAVALALVAPAAAQDEGAAQAAIRAALTQWMVDFNAGRADKVCALFAPDLEAQYRGQPERGYDALCELLKRSLADRGKSYRYALAIKEILVAGDLAVVRLTWTLTVRDQDSGRETTSVEPGIDVFRRQGDGVASSAMNRRDCSAKTRRLHRYSGMTYLRTSSRSRLFARA